MSFFGFTHVFPQQMNPGIVQLLALQPPPAPELLDPVLTLVPGAPP
jgi:hypothetical protein